MKTTIITLLLVPLVFPITASAGNRERANRRCSLAELLAELPVEALSPQETNHLLFSREEEKLARDVYLSLFERWDLRIFRQISRAEKTHMRAVLLLIEKYDLTDPIGGAALGVFSNQSLQDLYEDLVAAGSLSLLDALTVGAYVEEMDIADLMRQIAATDNSDIRTLYQNLMTGSRNHLRAFVAQLTARGIDYKPEILPLPDYLAIVDSPRERGGTRDENGDRVCGKRGRGN